MNKIEYEIINLIENYKPKEAYNLLNSKKKIKINYEDGFGNTILTKCANYMSRSEPDTSMELMKLIISKGANVNHNNIHNRGAIDHLLDDANLDAINLLIESGAILIDSDPNIYKSPYNRCYYLFNKNRNFEILFPIFKQETNTEDKFNIFKEMFNVCLKSKYSSLTTISDKVKTDIENYINKQENYFNLNRNLSTNNTEFKNIKKI